MNDHDLLDDLDQRGASAAADLRHRASVRPRPAFDPENLTVLPLFRTGRTSRSRRPLLAVVAAFLLVVGTATVLAVWPDDEGIDTAGLSTGELLRPFAATDLPAGLAPVGAFEATGAESTDGEGGPVPTDLYGPSTDRPGLGVAVATGAFDGGPEPTEAVDLGGGRTAEVVDTLGVAGTVLVVEVGSEEILVVSRELDRDLLVDVAREVSVVDGRAVIAAATLPAGWRRLGTVPDLLNAVSPLMATMRGGVGAEQTVVYGDSTRRGPTTFAAVSSSSGDELRLNVTRLFMADVQVVSVRGHEALMGTVSRDDQGATVTVAWLDTPGELVRVSGSGLPEDDLLRLAQGVEPLEAEAWTDLLRRSRRGELTGPDGGPAVEPIGEGTFADGTEWVLRAYEADPDSGQRELDLTVVPPDGRTPGDGSSSSSGSASVSGGEPDSGFIGLNTKDQAGRRFAYGMLGAGVTSVELRRADGVAIGTASTVDGDGLRAWVAELTEAQTTAVALDANGVEVGRLEFGNDEFGPSSSNTGTPTGPGSATTIVTDPED